MGNEAQSKRGILSLRTPIEGGVVTNWEGEEILSGGQVLASANQTLHDGALSIINN